VHGAFADASSWSPVTEQLLSQGHRVLVPPVFNRSLSGDAAYIKSFVEQINGPVILAGHSQRPLSAIAFSEPASAAAWKTKPGWGIVSSADRTINPEVERFGYKRAGLRKVVEIDAPHLVMQTHPAEVAALITEAIAELA
jgi:pimeloyl-ACP methyl ester carboxylesterase